MNYGRSNSQPSDNGSRLPMSLGILQDRLHYARKNEQKYWDSPEREQYSREIEQLEKRIEEITSKQTP